MYPNPLWQATHITASVSATEYVIYQSPVGNYGLFLSFVFTVNKVLADEIHIRVTFNDGSQFNDVFSNDVKQKVYSFNNESRGTIKQVYLYYTEISSLNVNSKIEYLFAYDYWGETAHTQYQASRGCLANNVVFVPYHSGIKRCQILKRSTGIGIGDQSFASIIVYVTDRLGIRRTSEILTIYHEAKYIVIENWGELNLYEAGCLDRLPNGVMIEVNVETRMDNAAVTQGFFSADNILTDRWFPSYNGITPEENGSETLVDAKEHFSGYPSAQSHAHLYLDKVIDNFTRTINSGSTTQNGTLVNLFKKAIDGGYRFGLLISPSTLPFTEERNNYTSSDGIVYYAFPTWMLNELNQSLSPGECARYYVVQKTDTYTGATIKIVYLNWANAKTRQLYKECIDIIHNYLNTTYISGKRIYKYIDYIKVAFAGTWGEGLSLDMSGTSLASPSYANLQEISDYIVNKFSDKMAILSLGTAFNSEFPKEYRDYVINGDNGIFYDGACNATRYHFLKVGSLNPYLSLSTPEMMNKAFLYSKEHLTYIECAPYKSDDVKPSYADLEAYVKYYSPDYLSIQNIFHNGRDADYNLKSTIRRISRYVGTRPYIGLKEIEKVFTGDNLTGLKIRLSIGNYGTAMFRSFWKLKFYLQVKYNGSSEMTEQEVPVQQLNSGNAFPLTSIPKPFEPGVPCFYDTKLISGTYNLPIGNQTVHILNLLVEIADEDGIFNNLLFCNSEEFLPREKNLSNSMTGRFYLLEYEKTETTTN